MCHIDCYALPCVARELLGCHDKAADRRYAGASDHAGVSEREDRRGRGKAGKLAGWQAHVFTVSGREEKALSVV